MAAPPAWTRRIGRQRAGNGDPGGRTAGGQPGGPAETATRASAQVMLANLTGSGTLDLASSTGKPTAVVFWLNTCPHCQEALRGVMVPTNPTRLAKALDRALRQTD